MSWMTERRGANGRIGMVDHKGDILLDSYVFVNPKNVLDYLTPSKRLVLCI